ncbi:hypothetical protein BDK51DRAFT_51841 [Blyttiomyces helicus]|uniref:Uncharacterized protein n=1 Tax=Blyttiomyces helicus TaxID=388810 RepID=A0A4P9WAM9_9FUNG|nr:hypothetical protein BDK51DRAFT_51841 [Blyttiomyces helicus]|eukprot:RKO89504.1 hypothetical protein BDK51DRAFT_51841 [Blyttiomyces helicus]
MEALAGFLGASSTFYDLDLAGGPLFCRGGVFGLGVISVPWQGGRVTFSSLVHLGLFGDPRGSWFKQRRDPSHQQAPPSPSTESSHPQPHTCTPPLHIQRILGSCLHTSTGSEVVIPRGSSKRRGAGDKGERGAQSVGKEHSACCVLRGCEYGVGLAKHVRSNALVSVAGEFPGSWAKGQKAQTAQSRRAAPEVPPREPSRLDSRRTGCGSRTELVMWGEASDRDRLRHTAQLQMNARRPT